MDLNKLKEKICDREYCQDLLAHIVQYGVLLGVIYAGWVLSKWTYLWFEPDWETIFDYMNVKLPSVIIGIIALSLGAWIYDLMTPGDFQKKISSDSLSSAIFMAAFVLALGLILAR
jgi:hypothetical protein